MAKAPHRFSAKAPGIYAQMDAPSGASDARYATVQPNGINVNHGWKIHADFVTDLTHEQGLAKVGRGADLSILDQDLAEQFDKRLTGLGVKSDDFFAFYKSSYHKEKRKAFGLDGAKAAVFADPRDIVTAAEVFDSHTMQYKMGSGRYGAGRHITAYPQSLERRDSLVASLEDRLGSRLVEQNDPSYRATLEDPGLKNHPISRGVSSRFTTDYLVEGADGRVDFALQTDDGPPVSADYKITGKINPEQVEVINRVTAEMPEMGELLHGKEGYISPYKTIEQIAQDRVSGRTAPTLPNPGALGKFGEVLNEASWNYRGALPRINKPGEVLASPVSAPASAPASAPVFIDDVRVTRPNPKIAAARAEAAIAAANAEAIAAAPVVPIAPVPTVPTAAIAAPIPATVPAIVPTPAVAPPTTGLPTSRGPTVGAPTSVRTTPGPHGAAITPSTTPTPPTAPRVPIIPATSPTAPTAKIISTTPTSTLTARDALRGIGTDINAARKPGQKLLSADGSKAMAEAVTKGIKGSRNLKMLAVGSALGLGGYTANRLANRGDTSDLRG